MNRLETDTLVLLFVLAGPAKQCSGGSIPLNMLACPCFLTWGTFVSPFKTSPCGTCLPFGPIQNEVFLGGVRNRVFGLKPHSTYSQIRVIYVCAGRPRIQKQQDRTPILNESHGKPQNIPPPPPKTPGSRFFSGPRELVRGGRAAGAPAARNVCFQCCLLSPRDCKYILRMAVGG